MKKFINIICIIFAVLFSLVAFVPNTNNNSVYADYMDTVFTKPDPVLGTYINNHVMMNFQGESNSLSSYNNLIDVYERLYNTNDHSLNNYYNQISNNKMNLVSNFVSDNDDDFKVITLSQTREYFMNYTFYDYSQSKYVVNESGYYPYEIISSSSAPTSEMDFECIVYSTHKVFVYNDFNVNYLKDNDASDGVISSSYADAYLQNNPGCYKIDCIERYLRELELISLLSDSLDGYIDTTASDKNNDGGLDILSINVLDCDDKNYKVEWSELLWAHQSTLSTLLDAKIIMGMSLVELLNNPYAALFIGQFKGMIASHIHTNDLDKFLNFVKYRPSVETNSISKNIDRYYMTNFDPNVIDLSLTDDKLAEKLEISTSAHELGHVFGLPDLYEYPSNSTEAVGWWSLMCYQGNPQHYMTAYERDYLGWLDNTKNLITLTDSGTYTVKATKGYDGENTIAYRVQGTGDYQNQWFYVEYRNKNLTENAHWESSTGSAGLLVYRVDSTVSTGNMYAKPYGLWIFRKSTSTISGATYKNGDIVGNFDLTQTTNALTYQDENNNLVNSGMRIVIKSVSDNEITFKFEKEKVVPVITLNGDEYNKIQIGSTFDDPLFTVKENGANTTSTYTFDTTAKLDKERTYKIDYYICDENYTETSHVGGFVSNAQRFFKLVYTIKDEYGETHSVTRYIAVGVKNFEISLVGNEETHIKVNDTYTDQGISVKEDGKTETYTFNKVSIGNPQDVRTYNYYINKANALKEAGVVVDNIDTSAVGYYLITYNIKDFNGEIKTIKRFIVIDPKTVAISLSGNEDITVKLNGTYTEQGLTITEDLVSVNYTQVENSASLVNQSYYITFYTSNELKEKLTQVGSIDTSSVGNYVVLYSVKDCNGNTKSLERYVSVVKQRVVITISNVTLRNKLLQLCGESTLYDDSFINFDYIDLSNSNLVNISGFEQFDLKANVVIDLSNNALSTISALSPIIEKTSSCKILCVGNKYSISNIDSFAHKSNCVFGLQALSVNQYFIVNEEISVDINIYNDYSSDYKLYVDNVEVPYNYKITSFGEYAIQLFPYDNTYSAVDYVVNVCLINTVKNSFKFKMGEEIEFKLSDYVYIVGYDFTEKYTTTFNTVVNFNKKGSGTFNIILNPGFSLDKITLLFNYEVYEVSDTLFMLDKEVVYLFSKTQFDSYNFDDYTVIDPLTTVSYTKPVYDGYKKYTVDYKATDTYGTEQTISKIIYVGNFEFVECGEFEYGEEYDLPYKLEYYTLDTFNLYYKVGSGTFVLFENGDKASFYAIGNNIKLTLKIQNKNDSLVNYSIEKSITVKDTVVPVVELIGDSVIEILIGDEYSDEGVKITDKCTGCDVEIKYYKNGIETTFDNQKSGKYTIVYTVTDLGGNVAYATRQVNVIRNGLFVLDTDKVFLFSEEEFNSYDYSKYTKYEEETVVSYTIPTFAGYKKYEVEYKAEDIDGNVQFLTKTIYVGKIEMVDIGNVGYNKLMDIPYELTAFTLEDFDLYYKIGNKEDFKLVDNSGKIKFDDVGEIELTLKLQNKLNQELYCEASKIYTIEDTEKPIIQLIGGDINLSVGDVFVDNGISIFDDTPYNKCNIIIKYYLGNNEISELDLTKPGDYVISYQVEDIAGNKSNILTRNLRISYREVKNICIIQPGEYVFGSSEKFVLKILVLDEFEYDDNLTYDWYIDGKYHSTSNTREQGFEFLGAGEHEIYARIHDSNTKSQTIIIEVTDDAPIAFIAIIAGVAFTGLVIVFLFIGKAIFKKNSEF